MRTLLYTVCILASLFFAPGISAQEATDLCPAPGRIAADWTKYVPLHKVIVCCSDTEVRDWTRRHLKAWYGKLAPVVEHIAQTPYVVGGEEAYSLSADANAVTIRATTLKGVRYALFTLRQLAIPQRGTERVAGWMLPEATLEDAPSLSFRGLHVCWFPENEPWEIERIIRMAAYYKLNYVVLEPWGTFRSRVAPWYGWSDGQMTIPEVKRLRRIACDLGVTLIPQLNVFGHATMSRYAGGKHAALDVASEYQPLFEPSAGWNWCLTNPHTIRLITSLMGELLDAFGNPPYFHIGCDEADPPSCPQCKAHPYSEIFLAHLTAVENYLASRGARPMMWHDMLLAQDDVRWNGFYHNGTRETAQALQGMPRDMIICDWYYEAAAASYPTLSYFQEQGFPVLACPWDNVSGIVEQGHQACRLGLEGILGTMWHHYYGENLSRILSNLANVAWGGKEGAAGHYSNTFRTHLRQIGWDMGVKERSHTGIYENEVPESNFLEN